MSVRLKTAIATAILLFQAVMIVHARFSPMRYYCWAPHDAQNEYRIHVTIRGRRLPPHEVTERYRIRSEGVDPRAIEHVVRLIDQYERTLGRYDGATVQLEYQTNGGPLQVRRWPVH